jgi:hypothetical protein
MDEGDGGFERELSPQELQRKFHGHASLFRDLPHGVVRMAIEWKATQDICGDIRRNPGSSLQHDFLFSRETVLEKKRNALTVHGNYPRIVRQFENSRKTLTAQTDGPATTSYLSKARHLFAALVS